MLCINCIKITDISENMYRLLRENVSEERRSKADRFRFFDDSKRSVCAEILLRYSLFQCKGGFIDLDIKYGKYGKPYVSNIHDFSFNLSHSGNWVVLGYGKKEIGIDIEEIKMGNDVVDVFFSEMEKKYIFGLSNMERIKKITQIWTIKESYIKYLGTGLVTSLNTFTVDISQNKIICKSDPISDDLQVISHLFDNDYYLSVCSLEKQSILKKIKWSDLLSVLK
ncbi:4'-phosphopantetheinyl transferase superfamily protein [Blautia pseudococcoides]|nr:4'-phosphopantetheinyl transferase superfamily protein [Blautia pseudococcoides]